MINEKNMKAKEIREKGIEELKKILSEKRGEAGDFRFEISSKQKKDHRDYRNIKKDIARIMTIIGEKDKSN